MHPNKKNILNKKLKITSYILAFLVVFYILMKFTGICAFYTIPVTSSEPNIKLGSYIIASNLITPKRGDFITYEFNNPEFAKAIWIHRLCAMEHDTIQIIDGVLFVNGKNFDEDYNLKHSYLLSKEKFNSLNDDTLEYFPFYDGENNGSYLTFVTDVDAKTYKLAKHRYIDLKTIPNSEIKNVYQHDWNKDHFGPLMIPEGKIFVLGDNRDNSIDSRVIGLIDANAITGVYWKTIY
jgi:signal peptidase I